MKSLEILMKFSVSFINFKFPQWFYEVVIWLRIYLAIPIPDPENKLEKNAIFGETFVYDCKGYGNPQPVVTWMKNDEVLNMSNSRITLKDSNDLINGSLRINNVDYDDSGEYTCRASNANGNFTVRVKVNVKGIF